jgi:hypothetical protein
MAGGNMTRKTMATTGNDHRPRLSGRAKAVWMKGQRAEKRAQAQAEKQAEEAIRRSCPVVRGSE